MDIVRVPILAPAAPAVFPVEVPVVALVASAGGLDALTRVLAPLSAELPAAVLVARHQDPTRVSQLVGFLEDRTALPVRAVRDGDRLEVGQVLVTPPAAHLIVTAAGVLGLIDTGAIPPARPSADLLLATLAVTAGPRVLAIVLTGTGHDAQAGIRAVHRCGGTVLAQDEASAEHFGMPSAAIATGLVHGVHPLDELAGVVVEHLHRQRRGDRQLQSDRQLHGGSPGTPG
jgi:two-component system chemotaxis response regulator CheB